MGLERLLVFGVAVLALTVAPVLHAEVGDEAPLQAESDAAPTEDAPAPDAGMAAEPAAVEPYSPSAEAPVADFDEAGATLGAVEEPSNAVEMPAEAFEDPVVASATLPPLGAVGYDSEGREGRIHIVVPGDTLWEISAAYLGTPWVWPSIWNDNLDIDDPHLIHPGDRIWITPGEMRRVTPEEAEILMSAEPAAPAPQPVAAQELETLPPPPPELPVVVEEQRRQRVSALETAGLITREQLDSSVSIVGSVANRVLLSQQDEVYIGLGEGQVEEGDEFTIFRTNEKVFDPDTSRLLGFHVDFLGWLEVKETYPETALATIRMSARDIEITDRLVPREPLPDEVPILPSPIGVEGKISYFPRKRVLMGMTDFVYLNRGTLDGIEVGSPLEVYREGYATTETARQERVAIPDRVIAELVVVRAATESSVALVSQSDGELKLGDRFRGAVE